MPGRGGKVNSQQPQPTSEDDRKEQERRAQIPEGDENPWVGLAGYVTSLFSDD